MRSSWFGFVLDIAEEHDPIPVAEFEEYVAEMHESRNEGFSAEYSVSNCILQCRYYKDIFKAIFAVTRKAD